MPNRADLPLSFRYYKIGKHFVCVDQSIYDAMATLIFGHNQYRLDAIGVARTVARRALKAVIKGKLGLLNPAYCVDLPVFGQIAMRVHRGFKVFDFKRLEVSKSFSRDTSSEEATKEIAAGAQASSIAAAPRFLAADPELGWYKEEYICGVRATDPDYRGGKNMLDFYSDVENCLSDLAACEPPLQVGTQTHLNRLASVSFRTAWLKAGLESGEIDEIEGYVEQLREWLANNSARDQLQLVLTHGDFSLVNAIATGTGLRFIDWEGTARGGLYSDILNFLFVERYYGRASAEFLNDLTVFVERYSEYVLSRIPELKDAAELDPTYARRLYYLERLSLLLERSASTSLHGVVKKSIVMFRKVDHEIGDNAS